MAASPVVHPPLDLDDIQALALTSWKRLQHACYLFVTFTGGTTAAEIRTRRQWLASVLGEVSRGSQVVLSRETDDALARPGGPPRLQIALTSAGLTALGGDAELLGLADEAKQGMAKRARFVGDGEQVQWELGGLGAPRIGALIACFASDGPTLDDRVRDHTARAVAAGATVVAERATWIGSREHFGFADGISQPIIAGSRPDRPPEPDHEVPAGEILLGYDNAYGRRPAGPRGERGGLPVDLGRNGSYLVFRKLQQHVDQFWSYFAAQARELMSAGLGPGTNASAAELDAWIDWLAAKVIGRWRSGAPLVLTPDHENPAKAGKSVVNQFNFRDKDVHGTACPIGSHIRRANPRDAREPDTSTADESRTVVRRHRVLRRGRSWGPPLDRQAAINGVRDGNRRGLLFICLQASIARGFEFVQQTWLSNLGFGGLSREGDPLARGEIDPRDRATHDGFTIPLDPIRIRLHGLPRFITTLGGDYFFMPSITALEYFAQ